ncbi:hypothetical protein DVA79_20360, partial [Acinetobacter baumannii]
NLDPQPRNSNIHLLQYIMQKCWNQQHDIQNLPRRFQISMLLASQSENRNFTISYCLLIQSPKKMF